MANKVYVVIYNDRHSEPDADVFSTPTAAVSWAKSFARAGGVIDEELTEEMLADGWLYYGCYSIEGDFVRVVERTIEED